MKILDEQELHNLAMNIVGKELEAKGWEFLAVNSQPKRDPQFVCVDSKRKKHFVVVRAISYPENPHEIDYVFMETIKQHASKFNAATYYAGVGLANAIDYEKPISSEEDYVVNYNGIIEI
ncbi:hypothetical protein SAMN05216480_103239 [Pustulibacterium marinum]|uniref:Na(+)-translocating NADH-quinone reductase subunit F n=1 Tax=Pustulibacterium marinum TaxID=1224947 RepID=A0A1I7G6J7_9FLAO|nr:Na(+)-translocating NADH-quinone reductase subunit F [Pustulibacterium marinum]SFU44074.1 hypothetical protein SAMN05216480_103239 [Pustulibacterium marinum]